MRCRCGASGERRRSIPMACAKPQAKPSAISDRKGRRRVSPPRSRWRSSKLQASGDIRRVPTNGRFDQQRYQYALWRPNPLRGFKLSPEEVHTELARRYFRWIGPASVTGFQTFSGLGVKAAKAALDPLKLEPIEICCRRPALLPAGRSGLRSTPLSRRRRPRYSLLG